MSEYNIITNVITRRRRIRIRITTILIIMMITIRLIVGKERNQPIDQSINRPINPKMPN